ncbi:MAG: DUF1326 domain-containing protein [Gammaproteobacteria bacterium]|nr:DUF1326 domain-containing protein [Gammaproteobacteria bacterium]MCP5200830.1 DUF1326 domain-containing protein [Gammaproteobacteria bacterium]
MATNAWTISGEYMESCNCDYLCPCIFTNPQAAVTYDHCTALLIFRIDEGRAGDVDLAGLKFALVVKSGKVMSEGGWVFGAIVDAAADDAQRAALTAIASGEAGGPPGMIRQNLVGDFRGVEYQPIDFRIEGETRAVTIADKLRFAIEGVLSRLGNGKPYYIDNVGHPASSKLALAQSKETHVNCFGLEMDIVGAGNNGHYASFAWAA